MESIHECFLLFDEVSKPSIDPATLCVLSTQNVNGNRLVLTHTVNAVVSLIALTRVPLLIEHDHLRGGSKVKSNSTDLVVAQNQIVNAPSGLGRVLVVKVHSNLLPNRLRCLPVKYGDSVSCRLATTTNLTKRLLKLREHNGALTIGVILGTADFRKQSVPLVLIAVGEGDNLVQLL